MSNVVSIMTSRSLGCDLIFDVVDLVLGSCLILLVVAKMIHVKFGDHPSSLITKWMCIPFECNLEELVLIWLKCPSRYYFSWVSQYFFNFFLEDSSCSGWENSSFFPIRSSQNHQISINICNDKLHILKKHYLR